MKKGIITCFVVVLILATSAEAKTRLVPSEYLTIQAAIDDANDGDTVIVADGIYTGDGNRDIDFKGKAITLKSENGPDNCIIDSNGTDEDPHRGFYFNSDEDNNSILNGFTITNGYTQSGGGVACHNSSPWITNCIIKDNIAARGKSGGRGGGIDCGLNTLITNCTIRGNWSERHGGGIAAGQGNPLISNCTISDNSSELGGAISCLYSSVLISDCNISENSSLLDGGGVYIRDGESNITNCYLDKNVSYRFGGAIACDEGFTKIYGCDIAGNSAQYGGAISFQSLEYPPDDPAINVKSCVITDNDANIGGAIYLSANAMRSKIDISNCTILNNIASEQAGGIANNMHSHPI